MRSTDKKELKAIAEIIYEALSRMENLKDQHEEWMGDHDDNWEYTKAGETAEEDHSNMEEWYDSLDSLYNEIDEIIQ